MKPSRKRAWAAWLVCGVVWLALIVQPESRGLFRMAVVLGGVVFFAGAIALTWRRPAVRYGCIALALFPLLLYGLPGRAVDSERLRDTYIASLAPYEGTTYMWGGENRIGIDCSGLVRRGFMVACLKEGLVTLNGRLVRKACSLWWYDASAEAMRDGYRKETMEVLRVPEINGMDHSQLVPGDMAVTDNGVHIFVFVGENRWMQADPGRGRAQYETVPVADSGWFGMPVRILRWTLLQKEKNSN